jgi:hypothetical protein
MQPTAPGQVHLIGIIQMEILSKLGRRGFPHIAAIVLFLMRREKADGHIIHDSQTGFAELLPFADAAVP